jgi:hypothetical protein
LARFPFLTQNLNSATIMNSLPALSFRTWPSSSRLVVAAGMLFAFGNAAIIAAPPTVTASLNRAEGTVRISLAGTPGVSYVVEASKNLQQWLPVTTSAAADGSLELVEPVTATSAQRFYRGREAGTNVIVGPLANTNVSLTTLIQTNGGSAVLYGSDGARYVLEFSPGTLLEPTLVSLTAVTNVAGLPFARGIIGAVRVDMNGVNLWGAASLRIIPSTNVPARQIVSFTANADGSRFRLAPDWVTTNGVIIPVVASGLYGSAQATAAELAGVTPLVAAPLNEGRLAAAAAGCFPLEAAEAADRDHDLSLQSDHLSAQLALILANTRQAQLDGSFEDRFDRTIVADVFEESACLFVENVRANLAAAQQNCALARVVLSHLLRVERQRQLLGLPANPECDSSLSSVPICAMMQNCLSEIEECCSSGGRGPARIVEILTLSRQDQLLGQSCLSQGEIDDAITACSPGLWSGTLILNLSGDQTETQTYVNGSTVEERRVSTRFMGSVTESEEMFFGPITQVTLQIRGQIHHSDVDITTTRVSNRCGGNLSIDRSEAVVSAPAFFLVIFQFSSNAPISILISNPPDPVTDDISTGEETDSVYWRNNIERVPGQCSVDTYSNAIKDVYLHSAPAFFGAGAPASPDGNAVAGSGEPDVSFLGIDNATARYNWNFTRRTQ